MKLRILAVALAATAFGSLAASAQTVVIEERSPPPAVIIQEERPATSVTVEKERGLLGTEKKTTVETTGSGCTTKTVRKENLAGSKTVERTDC